MQTTRRRLSLQRVCFLGVIPLKNHFQPSSSHRHCLKSSHLFETSAHLKKKKKKPSLLLLHSRPHPSSPSLLISALLCHSRPPSFFSVTALSPLISVLLLHSRISHPSSPSPYISALTSLHSLALSI
ncbi:hypothetical protein HanPSC8_Chr02g0074591 [Helianthus annuus]|nr:hypothetical protein HanPSC8_Chr02g0074591 [Helianthus annuus]